MFYQKPMEHGYLFWPILLAFGKGCFFASHLFYVRFNKFSFSLQKRGSLWNYSGSYSVDLILLWYLTFNPADTGGSAFNSYLPMLEESTAISASCLLAGSHFFSSSLNPYEVIVRLFPQDTYIPVLINSVPWSLKVSVDFIPLFVVEVMSRKLTLVA